MNDEKHERYLEEKDEAEKALMFGRATGRQFVLAQVSYEEWCGMQPKEREK